ncbi:MAG: aminotransferase class I/II-fold pyridoxal phosphate-dependent enzyme [Methanomassiliicoccales archaeon]|nr:MAG: aminotransferase class I/II-fold pyridoxal phosphate-dependent enzyme [Methanomassiliicoccales archaeon]
MPFDYATRLKKIPPYLFVEIEEKVKRKRQEGLDIIDFGIGDPDIPTPSPIVEEVKRQLDDPTNHRYPSSSGEPEVRRAVSAWYKRRFNVDVDPDGEVAILIGSKEGIANICRAFVNPGEKVLCPDPGYPVYSQGGTLLCDAVPVKVPLIPDKGFLPDLDALPSDARMLYLNYPNNPTGAVAPKDFLWKASTWCIETDTILAYDNAYSEMTFDDYVAPSILECCQGNGAIEFGSLSKTFNMTGFRIGYAVGDANLISGLRKVKSQIDSGAPMFIQKAMVRALEMYKGAEKPDIVKENIRVYEDRRNVLVKGLRSLGFKVDPPKGTFYLWLKVDGPSMKFADKLLNVGVVCTPGIGFGGFGEGYVRFATTQPTERIVEAIERMRKVL